MSSDPWDGIPDGPELTDDAEEYKEKLDDLIQRADDLAESSSFDDAREFARSVKTKWESMREFVLKTGRITSPMKTAIDNMAEGLEKWESAGEFSDDDPDRWDNYGDRY